MRATTGPNLAALLRAFSLFLQGELVADTGKGGRIRDPLEEGEDKSQRLDTSRNREESMTESGKDAFGEKSAVRNPDSSSQGDGTTDQSDTTFIGRIGDT